jgi:hypothetical protein
MTLFLISQVLRGGEGPGARSRNSSVNPYSACYGRSVHPQQMSPATSPSARDEAAVAYDAATGNMVIFGGFLITGQTLRDTWT